MVGSSPTSKLEQCAPTCFAFFSVKTRTWTAVDAPSGTGPSARSGHTAVAYKDSVFIYGGMFVKLNERREPQFNFLSDLWRFNVTDKIWSQVGGGEAKPPPKSKKKAKKSMPPPRNEHSAVVVDKTMWVMGGSDEQGPQSTVLAFHLGIRMLFRCCHPVPSYVVFDTHSLRPLEIYFCMGCRGLQVGSRWVYGKFPCS